jgi:hypothetical protein
MVSEVFHAPVGRAYAFRELAPRERARSCPTHEWHLDFGKSLA